MKGVFTIFTKKQAKRLKLQDQLVYEKWKGVELNRTMRIGHQCRETIVLSCHRCLINNGVEKMNYN